jgi:MFS family permease
MRATQPPPFRLRSLGISVYLPTFLFAVGQGAVIPIVALHARDLGATVAVAGLIVALRGIGNMAFDVPAGMLVSRLGERRAMVVGATMMVFVAIAAGTSRSLWVFAAVVLVMGCATAIWMLARLAYVSDVAPTEYRGRALSLLGGTNRVGNFVGPFVGAGAALLVGLEGAFYLQGALALSAAAVLWFTSRDERGERLPAAGREHPNVRRVLTDHRQVWLTAGIVALTISLLRASREVILPLWGDHVGLSAPQVSVIFGVSASIEMLLFYPAGIVMDRWGRKWTAVPCLLLLSAGLMLLPLTTGFASLLGVGMFLGFGNGLGSGIVMTLGSDFTPRIGRGEFLGVWRLVSDIGAASGPVVISAVTAAATLGVAAIVVGAIGAAGAVMMVVRVAEPLHRQARRRGGPGQEGATGG